MDLNQLSRQIAERATVNADILLRLEDYDAKIELVQQLHDRAALFERAGCPEMATIIRRTARLLVSGNFDSSIPIEMLTPTIPALPPEPRAALPAPAPEEVAPTPKKRGRPPKIRPEEPTNGDVAHGS